MEKCVHMPAIVGLAESLKCCAYTLFKDINKIFKRYAVKEMYQSKLTVFMVTNLSNLKPLSAGDN